MANELLFTDSEGGRRCRVQILHKAVIELGNQLAGIRRLPIREQRHDSLGEVLRRDGRLVELSHRIIQPFVFDVFETYQQVESSILLGCAHLARSIRSRMAFDDVLVMGCEDPEGGRYVSECITDPNRGIRLNLWITSPQSEKGELCVLFGLFQAPTLEVGSLRSLDILREREAEENPVAA